MVSVLCVVVTGSVGWGRRNEDRRVNGHGNNTLRLEQQGLGPAWRTKNEGSVEDGAAMTG